MAGRRIPCAGGRHGMPVADASLCVGGAASGCRPYGVGGAASGCRPTDGGPTHPVRWRAARGCRHGMPVARRIPMRRRGGIGMPPRYARSRRIPCVGASLCVGGAASGCPPLRRRRGGIGMPPLRYGPVARRIPMRRRGRHRDAAPTASAGRHRDAALRMADQRIPMRRQGVIGRCCGPPRGYADRHQVPGNPEAPGT
jgi:hypothetical protein